jgi:hypothetical protein
MTRLRYGDTAVEPITANADLDEREVVGFDQNDREDGVGFEEFPTITGDGSRL